MSLINDYILISDFDFHLFLGLPNHCKLEVVPCENQTSAAAQKVKIALQLEQGGRVIGEYSSEDTLDKIYENNPIHPQVFRKEIGKETYLLVIEYIFQHI